jgi:O-acetyl-ADP-ribose deacetylase (regulator of RNase III)
MTKEYIKGDVRYPIGDGIKIIPHICNDIGRWGRGFVLSLSEKWKLPEKIYRSESNYNLGDIKVIKVEDDILIINMIAQHKLKSYNNKTPLDYYALECCLYKCQEYANKLNTKVSFHMPKIGAGLGGGDWIKIEKIINYTIKKDVYIYEI